MAKVYLAGPVSGVSWLEATAWRNRAKSFLQGMLCIDPLEGKEHLQGYGEGIPLITEHSRDQPAAILDAAFFNVQRCDVLLVYLEGASQVSVGTVMEIGLARWLHKPVIIVAESARNVHNHPMITACATAVLPSLAEAANFIEHLVAYSA